ncbi:hypothetical protein MTO96_019430 [Rhipicephalus appendiculatus]
MTTLAPGSAGNGRFSTGRVFGLGPAEARHNQRLNAPSRHGISLRRIGLIADSTIGRRSHSSSRTWSSWSSPHRERCGSGTSARAGTQGTLVGVSSTAENKTYPTIKVMGVQKPAVVVVSCVTKDQPYRVHPHNLVGKEGCKNGICTQHLKPDMTCTFTSLGIQCVKRRDVEQNLLQRENIRVDPFRNGFAHKDQAASIDLNAVRLCFQVFLEGSQPGKFTVPLHPVVSDIIYDRKAMSDLTITKLSHTCAPMSGGLEMILLCDKVAKDDIEVWFEEERDGQTVWKERAELLP